jgi:hypothetical protein
MGRWPLAHSAGHIVGARPEVAQVLRRQHTGSRRDLALKLATSRPDQESWDFDKDEQDFGEKKNPRKPHANP